MQRGGLSRCSRRQAILRSWADNPPRAAISLSSRSISPLLGNPVERNPGLVLVADEFLPLLAQPGQRGAHAVDLPAGGLGQIVDCRALGALQQREDRALLGLTGRCGGRACRGSDRLRRGGRGGLFARVAGTSPLASAPARPPSRRLRSRLLVRLGHDLNFLWVRRRPLAPSPPRAPPVMPAGAEATQGSEVPGGLPACTLRRPGKSSRFSSFATVPPPSGSDMLGLVASSGLARLEQGISMRSHTDLSRIIKFLARDEWKALFEKVLGQHFGPAMQEFGLEYEAIGAALCGGWDMTLWGVVFEDFLGREFEPDSRNFVDEYLKRRGWNESAPAKTYMRGLRNSVMSLYEASAIVPGQSFLARDLVRGGEPVLISERTATRTLKEWDRIAARIVVQGQKRVLAGGVLAFTFEGSERLITELQEAALKAPQSARSASSGKKTLITDDNLRELAP